MFPHRSRTISRIAVVWLLASLGLVARAEVKSGDQRDPGARTETEGAEEPAEHKNTLKWKTASELENFAYDVYRGDSEDGPFERISAEPIPGAGTTDETSAYQFVDDTIDPYQQYWYYVESISLSGARERFTPIFAAKPKLTRETSAAESEPAKEGEDPDR